MRFPASPARSAFCALLALAVLLPAGSAAATQRCPSGDLRYPFEEGGPKTFGVFKLRIDGGGCKTAHRVAEEWMDRFESHLAAGHVKLPRRVEGFTFVSLPPKAAQTYRLRGRKDAKTIRFDYVVPNG